MRLLTLFVPAQTHEPWLGDVGEQRRHTTDDDGDADEREGVEAERDEEPVALRQHEEGERADQPPQECGASAPVHGSGRQSGAGSSVRVVTPTVREPG